MPEFRSKDGIGAGELAQLEATLRQDGYHLTEKTNEKQLLPKEYLKRPHSASTKSFLGPTVWLVVWRVQ